MKYRKAPLYLYISGSGPETVDPGPTQRGGVRAGVAEGAGGDGYRRRQEAEQ